jgi:fatty acid/phospholipid biosynthesis enzyme
VDGEIKDALGALETRFLERLERTETTLLKQFHPAEERLDRIEAALEKLTAAQVKTDLTVNRLVRYATLIARIHEDEIGSLKNRVSLLEMGEEGTNGDTITR